MNIVCATDGNYMRHCVAMLNSLWNLNQDPDLHVYLIFDNANSHELSLAVSHLRHLLPGFSLLQASPKPLEGFPVNGHATVATYFRLLLPELLPMSAEKVIFIDADTVVTDSLSPLWKTSLQGHSLAAVPEHRISCKDHGHEFGSYFNAGIMLIDLKKWRESNLLQRGRIFASNYPERMRHWDQDVLNHVFKNDWLPLPDRWNACPHLFGLTPEYKGYDYVFTADEKEAVSNPAIVHFAGPGPIKPWNAQCQHVYKDHYLSAKAATPWATTPLDDIAPPSWLLAMNKAVFQTKCFVRRNLIGND
ncbi:MAG: glycosyltransferase family 8 protein [Betaproteobacteria bacterium]